MRIILIFLSIVPLVACMETRAPAADLRGRQEAACTSVIAAHIGRPEAEVSSRWISDGKVEARDGNRLHICNVDSSGHVHGYTHPGRN